MENIICINLTKVNNEKLEEVAKLLSLNYERLLKSKKSGIAKVFIYKGKDEYIAFTKNKDKNSIEYTAYFRDALKAIPSEIIRDAHFMSVDNILDKINAYGIESLTTQERNFLKNSSK